MDVSIAYPSYNHTYLEQHTNRIEKVSVQSAGRLDIEGTVVEMRL